MKLLLLAQPNPRFTLDDLKKPQTRHDLAKLYAELPPDDREHIELHFRKHWSLHDYDTRRQVINTAEDFIADINGHPALPRPTPGNQQDPQRLPSEPAPLTPCRARPVSARRSSARAVSASRRQSVIEEHWSV